MGLKKRNKIAILLIAVILHSCAAMSMSKKERIEVYERANEHYSKAQYQKAYDEYKKLVYDGVKNAIIFYNLGNCAFRLKKIGESILWYRRALWIDPGYGKARKNLSYVQTFLQDKMKPAERTLVEKVWFFLLELFSLNLTAIVLLVLFTFGCITIILYFRKRSSTGYKKWRILLINTWIVIILWSGMFFAMLWRLYDTREVVILSPSVDVRSGPSNDNPVLFTVHEGLMVDVGETTSGWEQIILPNGWNGWVKKSVAGEVQRF